MTNGRTSVNPNCQTFLKTIISANFKYKFFDELELNNLNGNNSSYYDKGCSQKKKFSTDLNKTLLIKL